MKFAQPLLLAALVPFLAQAQVDVTALNPTILQGATGVTTDTSSLGSLRITYGSVSGFIEMQLPSKLIVVPCGQSYCLPTTEVTVRHNISALRQLSIIVNSSCTGPVSGFGFVADSLFKCDISGNQIDAQNVASIRAVITMQRSVGDPTATINVLYNWRVAVPVVQPPPCPSASPANARLADETSCPTDKDGISLDFWLPNTNNQIFALADLLPAFCGTGLYTFPGTVDGEIVLRLLDDKGITVAFSQPRRVPPGSQQAWGGLCLFIPELVYIPESTMPSIPIPAGAKADQLLTTYHLQATIQQATDGKRKQFSNTAEFPVVPGAIPTLNPSLYVVDRDDRESPVDISKPFTAEQADLANILARVSRQNSDYVRAGVKWTLDFAGDSALLSMTASTVDYQDRLIDHLGTSGNVLVKKGVADYKIGIGGIVYAGTAAIIIQPRLTLPNGQVLSFPPLRLETESVEIDTSNPNPRDCTLQEPQKCLIAGTSATVEVGGFARAARPGGVLVRLTTIDIQTNDQRGWTSVETSKDLLNLTSGQNTPFVDTVQLGVLNVKTDRVTIQYYLRFPGDRFCQCASDTLTFQNLPRFQVGVGVVTAGTTQEFPGGSLNVTQSNTAKNVNTFQANVSLAALASANSTEARKYTGFAAAVNNPDFIPIQSTVMFDSTVPRSSGFSARLTLNYTDSKLPKGPNVRESLLQVVSLDSAGVLHTYPTLLNMTAGTASTQIDSLDPYYSLAVVGPFANSSIHLANAASGYALVNTGTQDASVQITPRAATGAGTAADSTIRSANSLTSGSAASVSATSPSSAIRAVSWSEAGPLLDVSPATAPGLAFAFTDVEYGARKTTELRWANTTPFPAGSRVTLYNPDGTARGTHRLAMNPYQAVASRIESMFSSLPKDFVGYAILASDQPVTASAAQITGTTSTGIAAQPITDANLDTKTRFAPRLGENEGVATIHVVNLGTSTASITLRGRTSSGAAAGTTSTFNLAAGQQSTRALATAFGTTANTIASVQMDSSTIGVLGDLMTADASFIPTYAVSIPLAADPTPSSVLPYATGSTAVYLYNPSNAAANVGATAYSADGSKGTTSSTTLPPLGRASLQVSSTGYVAIASSQPVVAAGFLTTDGGAVSGYLALPSAAIAVPPTSGGTLPSATSAGVVNAGSFKGGAVSPGEIVTIFGSNFGTSALTLLRLLANGRVATDAAQTRFLFDNVAAPIVYVVTGQASVIVPYSVAGKATTQLVIEYQGRRSDPITLTVASSAPALFSANSSGTGPGAILNQNGSVNTPTNPADKRSIVILFGTGEGNMSPAVPDGSVTAGIVRPVLPVTVTIGGVVQKVLYAGAAPSLVAGVLQVNVEIDPATPSGNQPVIVTVGGVSSQTGLTVAIAGSGGAQQAIAVTPTSLDFGSVTSGQTKDLTLTVRNNGSTTLTVSSITSSNARFAAAVVNPPFNVGAGSFQTATIRFSPTAAGAQSGTLTINSNDPVAPAVTVSVSGTGTAAAQTPTIVLEPASLDFGSVTTGQTRDLTFNIRNTGNGPLTVTSATSSNARFTLVGSAPFTVSAGSFVTATIRFSPTAPGVESGTFTLTSNDPASPAKTLSVSGTGAAVQGPTIVLEPTSLDFGNVNTGQTKDLFFTVRNTGTATLTVTSVTSSNPRFALAVIGTPFNTGAGSFNFATIRFSPLAAGAQTATITFASNDAANPTKTVTVTGTGVGGSTGTPAIVLDPVSLDFGNVTAGQSKDLTVAIRNTGTATLTITAVTTTNSRFSLVGVGTPLNIAAGGSQNITVRFSPISSSLDSSTITFTTNDPARPTVQLPASGNSGIVGGGGGGANKLTVTSAAGWPNGRTSNQLPALAIDGNTNTYTWTTEAFNAAAPSFIGVSLGASASVSRLRIYKDNDSGGAGPIAKNLTIEYTTSDPSVPLASRVWTQVSGLANGFNGTELLVATAVNANGTVTADNHVSQSNGWASLTFTPVNATGIRIGFSNVTSLAQNHYRVYELELYGGSGGSSLPTIAFGQTINGSLSAASGRSVGCPTCFADVYQLTVTTARTVSITLTSGAFDAYLTLLTPLNEGLAEDDDGAGGTNARILGTIQPGTYRIEVSTATPGGGGAYTLTIAP